ncbi:MAG: sigma-70 family RNA polymerase sigma factor [Bacteroides sp.]|nr:sigma-70 family RNA polymerase sigma factor [Bacteroides sp.]
MTHRQFTTQVEATQSAFRRFLTALCCGDKELADDLAQEAYIRAYTAVTQPDNFRAWLYRTGYNLFLNYRRSEKTYCDSGVLLGCHAEQNADDTFRYQELYTALDSLPPKERMSVLLYYLEGYSTKEIAAITETSDEAVRQHLARGRRHLRELL